MEVPYFVHKSLDEVVGSIVGSPKTGYCELFTRPHLDLLTGQWTAMVIYDGSMCVAELKIRPQPHPQEES